MRFQLFFCFLSVSLFGAHKDLSYSRSTIHFLPEIVIESPTHCERLVFLHIPKTAGTNLDNIFKVFSCIRGDFDYQRLPVPRIQGRSPILITSDWMGGLKQLEDKPHLLSQIPNKILLTGHFPYEEILESCKYITLIRSPLERELSSANFDLQRGYIEEEQIESYLLERMLDNPQTRMIAGKQFMQGPCSEQTFIAAKANIEKNFFLAAPSEDVDLFIQIIAANQGWGPVAYAPMQITKEKISLNSDLTAALKEKHKWDTELYAWVKDRWESWKDKQVFTFKTPLSTIPTLLPDFLSTREVVFLTMDQIHIYNMRSDGALCEGIQIFKNISLKQ